MHRDQQFILKSITNVGKEKALGYLPLNTILNILKLSIDELKTQAEEKQLCWFLYDREDCCVKSGAFFVYEPDKVLDAIKLHKDILQKYHIATNPKDVIINLATNWYEPGHEIMNFIRELYGDQLN
jgi:hypothetical protein